MTGQTGIPKVSRLPRRYGPISEVRKATLTAISAKFNFDLSLCDLTSSPFTIPRTVPDERWKQSVNESTLIRQNHLQKFQPRRLCVL